MKKILVTVMVMAMLLVGVQVGAEEYIEGNWMVRADEDPLTDEFKLMLINAKDYSNGLGVRYQNGKLSIMIMTEYLGTDSDEYFSDVAYRFDKNEVVETYWSTATSDEALFFEEDEHTEVEFIDKLMKHQELAVGYYPYQSNRTTVVYDLTGFTAAITPYLDKIGLSELE
jgi:hypothetical protein